MTKNSTGFAAAWPDGTPRSQGNAFTSFNRDTASSFTKLNSTAAAGRRQTAVLARQDAAGDSSTRLTLSHPLKVKFSPLVVGRDAQQAMDAKRDRNRRARI